MRISLPGLLVLAALSGAAMAADSELGARVDAELRAVRASVRSLKPKFCSAVKDVEYSERAQAEAAMKQAEREAIDACFAQGCNPCGVVRRTRGPQSWTGVVSKPITGHRWARVETEGVVEEKK